MLLKDIILEGQFSKSEYAYHATSVKNLPSIMKQGLVPNHAEGGYGSEETSYSGYSKNALEGTYLTKSGDDAKYIANELGRAIIIVCKIQPQTTELDEDDLVGGVLQEYDLTRDVKANPNINPEEMAKHKVDELLKGKLSSLDPRQIANVKDDLYNYFVLLISFVKKYGIAMGGGTNRANVTNGAEYQAENSKIRQYQSTLTKKLRNLVGSGDKERFKIKQPVTFSGANKIVGVYNPESGLAWGDTGFFERSAYHHVKNPKELLNK